MNYSLYFNGIYANVLEEIIAAQKIDKNLICYLQPYKSHVIQKLRDDSPTLDSPLTAYISVTTDLSKVIYKGKIIRWENKQELSSDRLSFLNKHIKQYQPGETEIYMLNSNGNKPVNLISIIDLVRLDSAIPVNEFSLIKNKTPLKLRTQAGGWSYLNSIASDEELKLLKKYDNNTSISTKYFWVNQGKTWKEEHEGGYLWCPYKTIKRTSIWHWDTISELQKGDIVFSCKDGKIIAVCIVKNPAYKSQRPKEFGNVSPYWGKDGRKCDVTYKVKKNPLVIKEHFSMIQPLLPDKYSPVNKISGKTNEVYLVKINKKLGEYFLRYIDKKLLMFDKAIEGESEIVEQTIETSEGIKEQRKIKVEVTRVIRDTKLSNQLKIKYNYSCQICGLTINTTTVSGKYAEAAHIKPISDNGDDKLNNIICLCPNHHTMLDFGAISINDDNTLIGMEGELKINHRLNKDNLKYHRENIFNKFNN